ncbi:MULTISPECIES: flavodoxin [Clostridium]|uniref:Flavodoxin n=1 Tax=Clostridium butyricum TaxID=1492 RepID=A0AAP9RGG6_CLOBU|nr:MULTISPECIES: flavodoxin [Clostridium]AXB85938.1 flavodoxin [Clostridium butyricum]KIU09109.1 flavodoxin [Clostridium butyricum]KJZ82708.1 Flavodoxin [Clostridium sp. IBUN22A]KJZ87581.1 Flavodoxin [Clostridium sp. IBUN125C]KJZ92619.1 Flavodoxin [Clostridium sp. IBUN62F]
MKKVSIIYWSLGGNIEVLANVIADSAKEHGAEVVLKHVADANVEDVRNADAVAFGSPAKDSTKIEQREMHPFIENLSELKFKNKECILFATYGWIENTFMDIWKKEMKSYGFNIIGDLAVKESPTKAQIEHAKELGKMLAQ